MKFYMAQGDQETPFAPLAPARPGSAPGGGSRSPPPLRPGGLRPRAGGLAQRIGPWGGRHLGEWRKDFYLESGIIIPWCLTEPGTKRFRGRLLAGGALESRFWSCLPCDLIFELPLQSPKGILGGLYLDFEPASISEILTGVCLLPASVGRTAC